MNLTDLQTISIGNFRLKWRWTDPTYCELPEDELALIQPLSEGSAKQLWEKSRTFLEKDSDFSFDKERFQSVDSIKCTESKAVKQWLTDRLPTGALIISWRPDTAVLTQAALFTKYWEEFCYPSSDDVAIWSETENWLLHYSHEEVFSFGRTVGV